MAKNAKHEKSKLTQNWDRLDNAGKFYPAVSTEKWSSLFRVAIVMKNDVNPELLQQAADLVLPRFPTLNAQLSAGFFWYTLKKNPKRLLVQPDNAFPCSPIHWRRKNAHLLKILYTKKRIAVDIFHAITDGAGAFIFLKTLVAEYLRLTGINVPVGEGVLDINEAPWGDELIDSCTKLPLPKSKGLKRPGRAFRFPVHLEWTPSKHIHTYLLSVPELKEKAKEVGVTINEYLTAAFLYMALQVQLKNKPRKLLPVRVSVPVNMRRYYESNTLRNFSTFVTAEITPPFTDVSFESIALIVREYMQKALTVENLYNVIAPTIALENSLLSRITPLFLKNFIIQSFYKFVSSKNTTTTLTNLGVFTAPEALMNELETVEVLLGPARDSGVGATVITTGDTMRIAFTSTRVHPRLAEALESFLEEKGIKTVKEVISE